MSANISFKITHIVPKDLPESGYRKIYFFTTKDDPNEFYFGTDNNPFPKKIIDLLVSKGDIVEINPVEFNEAETLYTDSSGDLYLAYYLNSKIDRRPLNQKITVPHNVEY